MSNSSRSDSNSHIYEFEIMPQHAPNIFVSVFLLKPVDEYNPIATWRVGMTQLQVDIEQKALNIDISADRDSAGPQETVQYRLSVTDYKGDPGGRRGRYRFDRFGGAIAGGA